MEKTIQKRGIISILFLSFALIICAMFSSGIIANASPVLPEQEEIEEEYLNEKDERVAFYENNNAYRELEAGDGIDKQLYITCESRFTLNVWADGHYDDKGEITFRTYLSGGVVRYQISVTAHGNHAAQNATEIFDDRDLYKNNYNFINLMNDYGIECDSDNGEYLTVQDVYTLCAEGEENSEESESVSESQSESDEESESVSESQSESDEESESVSERISTSVVKPVGGNGGSRGGCVGDITVGALAGIGGLLILAFGIFYLFRIENKVNKR